MNIMMLKVSISTISALIVILLCTCGHVNSLENKSPSPGDSPCPNKILDICFENAPPLIDSDNHYTGALEDTIEHGYLLLVYRLSPRDSLSLKQQAVEKGFEKLPIKTGNSYPFISKYYENCQNGSYRITKKTEGLFTRIEIMNFEQMNFIIFQFGK